MLGFRLGQRLRAGGRFRDGRFRDGRFRDGRFRDGRFRDGRFRDGRFRDGRPDAASRARGGREPAAAGNLRLQGRRRARDAAEGSTGRRRAAVGYRRRGNHDRPLRRRHDAVGRPGRAAAPAARRAPPASRPATVPPDRAAGQRGCRLPGPGAVRAAAGRPRQRASAGAAIPYLQAAEHAAAARLLRQLAAVSPSLAQLMASVAASEATHVSALAAAAATGHG